MAGKVLGGAVGAAYVAAGIARHVLWYVSYRVDGQASARVDAAARKLSGRNG